VTHKTVEPHDVVWNDAKVARLWGYYAENPSYQAQYFSLHSGHHILRAIGRHVDLRRGDILDFGCGPGHMVSRLVENTRGKIHGLDFSEESVRAVERRFSGRPGFGKAVWARSLPSEFPDASMDGVLSIEVVEHLTDEQLAGMWTEIRRVLKPGGWLVVTTPHEEDLGANKTLCPDCGAVFHRWQHLRRWSAAALEDHLARAGFVLRRVEPTFFLSRKDQWLFSLKQTVKRLLPGRRPAHCPHLLAVAEKRG